MKTLTFVAAGLSFCLFSNLDALPKTEVENSTLTNSNTNVINTAGNKSEINSGLKADNAKIDKAVLTNANTNVLNTAGNKSKINSGIDLGN